MKKPEPEKAKGKLRSWIERQRIAVRLWLYRKGILLTLGFVGLNAVDGYLTNYAHSLAVQSGIQASIEANPFLAAVAGHWALSFKGLLGAGAIGLLAYFKHFTPNKFMWYMMIGCVVFGGIVLWNLHKLGVI